MPEDQGGGARAGRWRAQRKPGDRWLVITFEDASGQAVTLGFARAGLLAFTECLVDYGLEWMDELADDVKDY